MSLIDKITVEIGGVTAFAYNPYLLDTLFLQHLIERTRPFLLCQDTHMRSSGIPSARQQTDKASATREHES